MENFTNMAHALYECCVLNKNNKRKLIWSDECQKSFESLRNYLTDTTKVLMIPDFTKTFKLFTDAYEYGIGEVLTQEDVDAKEWRPVTYFSKHLSKPERNYAVGEKELLSIVRGIEFNKQFLYSFFKKKIKKNDKIKANKRAQTIAAIL